MSESEKKFIETLAREEEVSEDLMPLKKEPKKVDFGERREPNAMELEAHPGKIIRKDKSIDGRSSIEAQREIGFGKKLLTELKEKYHIPLSFHSFVAQHDKEQRRADKASVFTVTDKIEGTNLKRIEFSREETETAKKQIEELLSNLAAYLTDKYTENEDYLWDVFSPWQYVYGRKSGESKDSVYLVDVDFITTKTLGPKYWFICTMRNLFDFTRLMEKKLNDKLLKPRKIFENWFDNLPAIRRPGEDAITSEILNFISGQ